MSADLQELLGDVVESDSEVASTIERHKSTMQHQDRQKSFTAQTKSRELEHLRQTTSRLMEELDNVRKQHTEDLRLRVTLESSLHEIKLDALKQKHALDAATSQCQELQRTVQTLEREKQELHDLLEGKIVALRRRNKQLREAVSEAEARDRATLVWAESTVHAAMLMTPPASPPKSDVARELILIATLERLHRQDVALDESRAFQTLLNRSAQLERSSRSTPVRAHAGPAAAQPRTPEHYSHVGASPLVHRPRTPPPTHRPWYPPGAAAQLVAHSTPKSSLATPSKSRSPSRSAIPATTSNMQQLLANLSTWSEHLS